MVVVFVSSVPTTEMYSLKLWLAFGLAVGVAVNCHYIRIARSPDSVEASMPGYTTEEPPNEDQLNEEGEYWQGEGEKQNERYEQDRENRNKTAEENQQNLENEREYREEQQQKDNEQMQNNYESNRDHLDDRQQNQEEHYNNTEYNNPDVEEPSQQASEDLGGTGDRYAGKGQDEVDDREEKIENADNPSVTYNRD